MDSQRLKLEQVEKKLSKRRKAPKPVPYGGWLRTIREALGLTIRLQANRVGLSAAALHSAEKSEAEGRITLAQLKRLADALDCDLSYELIPRENLGKTVERQAKKVAVHELTRVNHLMRLEAQELGSSEISKKIKERQMELIHKKWSKLWKI